MPAEGWYVDGEPLEQWGTVIEDMAGWHITPAVRGENTVLLGQHGERWRPKRFGPGRLAWTVRVEGTLSDGSIPAQGSARRARWERNYEQLLRRVLVRHRPILVERVHAVRNGTTPRRHALCEITGVIDPVISGWAFGSLGLELLVPGTWWSDVDPISQRLPYDLAGPAQQVLELHSLAGQTGSCSDSVITVTGPCTSIAVTDTETGRGWSHSSPLGAGQTLVVDSGAFTAQVAAADVLSTLVFAGPNLLDIVPAPSEVRGPRLTVTATGTAAGFSVVAVTRRKWVSP